MEKKMILIMMVAIMLAINMSGKKEWKKEVSAGDFQTAEECVEITSDIKNQSGNQCVSPCVPLDSTKKSCLSSYCPTCTYPGSYAFIQDYDETCSSIANEKPTSCLYGGSAPISSCSSGDSSNSGTIKDTSTNHYGVSVTDRCLNGGDLVEYYCKNNELSYFYIDCRPGTCSNGVCNSACTDECTPSGATQCSGSSKQTCGNYDADSCLEWKTESCPNGCSGGVCTGSCPILGDTAPACDGIKVNELGAVAQIWISAGGPTGTLLDNLASAAQNWINNGGPA